MPKEYTRSERIGVQLQRELAQLVREEVRDPRVGNVTVCDVRASRDLSVARVFVAVLGGDRETCQQAVDGLNHAAGFLRTQLGRRLHVRTVPALQFEYDETLDEGARLSALIDDALSGRS